MPGRSIRRQSNEIAVRRSTRIARYNGLIDDITEAVIMRLSPKKRRRWGPEGRPKLTGHHPDGSLASRRQWATIAAGIAAAQAAAEAVKAAADAADEAFNGYDSDETIPDPNLYRCQSYYNDPPQYMQYVPSPHRFEFDGFDEDGEIMCGQPPSPVF